ncbi:MAG: hypothetical protein ACYS32_09065, partial [Planctomycetota bacterium]
KGDYFGQSVSISGDYAIAGAKHGDGNSVDSGSAYIFKREGEIWIQQAKLTASDGSPHDIFGNSVSINEDYCVVGAQLDDDHGNDSGSAYIFKREGEIWFQQAKLIPSDATTVIRFGCSVSINKNYCIVGASWSDAAYIFKLEGVTCYCLIGTYGDDDNGNSSGSAYSFKREGEVWIEQAKLIASDGAASDYFGGEVSIDANCCLISATGDDDNGDSSGSAYLFMKDGTLVALEINGPEELFQYSSVQYQATACYDNGIRRDATQLVDWSVEPNEYASIDPNGLLTTNDIAGNLIIYAKCADIGTNKPAEVRCIPNAVFVPGQYETIQLAIDTIGDGNVVMVAPGVYTGAGNRDIDFQGKAIIVRSMYGPETCIVDCQHVSGHRGFIFHNGEGPSSVLSGFTIKRGKVLEGSAKGGGVYCSGSSPTIENCVIIDNIADGTISYTALGGGIFIDSDSGAIIDKCKITGNVASGGDGKSNPTGYAESGRTGYGGGIFCGARSSLFVNFCEISNNQVTGGKAGYSMMWDAQGGDAYGGGICLGSNSELTVSNSKISDNSITYGAGAGGSAGYDGETQGGGIYCDQESVSSIENCLITKNQVTGGNEICIFGNCFGGEAYGGGISFGEDISSTIGNCTVSDNILTVGNSTVYGAGVSNSKDSAVTVENSIIWGNIGANEIHGNVNITYSDIEGGYPGSGNIDDDPCFAPGTLGDYYLGHIATGQASDSPCVDAGGNLATNLEMDIYTTRIDHINDSGIVDIGYHHFISNPADINGQGDVDFIDYAILTSQWKQIPGVPSADIAPPGGDGVVDGKDLAFLVKYWLWGK